MSEFSKSILWKQRNDVKWWSFFKKEPSPKWVGWLILYGNHWSVTHI